MLKEIVREFIDSLSSKNRIMIIPHWDADGVASASTMLELLYDWAINTIITIPKIGFYNVHAINKQVTFNNIDAVLLLDYALSEADLNLLRKKFNDVDLYVIDHHANPLSRKVNYLNPYLYGTPLHHIPSTTWVIHEYLGVKLNLKIMIGVIGDLNPKYEEFYRWEYIQKTIEKNKWQVKDLIYATELIDVCYQTNNSALVEAAIYKLVRASEPQDIIYDKELRNSYDMVRREINKILSSLTPIKIGANYKIYSIKTRLFITSQIGRILAFENKDQITILISDIIDGPKSIYVRSYNYNLLRPLAILKNLGYNVGGKENVFSLQISNDINQALNDVIYSLRVAEKK